MDRRRFLGVTGSTASAPVGWFLATDRSPTYPVALDSSTFEYVLSMRSLGPDVGELVTAFGDLDGEARDPLETAMEDEQYGTDDPPPALREFFSRPEATPRYVSDDDTYYELDADLPVFIVGFEEVSPETINEEPATIEEFVEAISDDRGRRGAPVQELVEGGEYRTYRLDPKVASFVEENGYLETNETVGRIDIDTDDPGPPYEITANEVSAEVVHGGIVIELADAPFRIRDLVEEGIDRHRMGLDTIPDALSDLVSSYDYVRVDDWFYEPVIEGTGPKHLPVELGAALLDDSIRPFDPARIELSITNTGKGKIGVFSGAPGPFGILRAESEDGRLTLWSDAYAESDHVHTTGRSVSGANDIGIVTELDPGEIRTAVYEIGRWGLAPGTYLVDDSVGIERYVTDEDGESAVESRTFPYELRIEIG